MPTSVDFLLPVFLHLYFPLFSVWNWLWIITSHVILIGRFCGLLDSSLRQAGLNLHLVHCILFLDKSRHTALTVFVKNAYKACVGCVVV